MWIVFLFVVVYARENDPFSARKLPIKEGDVIVKFNEYLNMHFDQCALQSNLETIHKNCKKTIYDVKHSCIIEHKFEEMYDKYLYYIQLKNSIYGIPFLSNLASIVSKPFLVTIIAPVFVVWKNGVPLYIGMDKIGHFFEQGYTCYEKGYDECIKMCINSENTYYGLLSSGVYSYADIYANLQGLKIWQQLSEKHYTCSSTTCVKNEYIRLEDYIDEFWDESINPSKIILPWVKKRKIYVLDDLQTSEHYRAGVSPELLTKVLSQ